jgi:hypothetical protein
VNGVEIKTLEASDTGILEPYFHIKPSVCEKRQPVYASIDH